MCCLPVEVLVSAIGVGIAIGGRVHLTDERTLSGRYARIFGLVLMGIFPLGLIAFFAVAVPVSRLTLANGFLEGFIVEVAVDVSYVILAVVIGLILHRFQEADSTSRP
jgi:hypothetical protein